MQSGIRPIVPSELKSLKLLERVRDDIRQAAGRPRIFDIDTGEGVVLSCVRGPSACLLCDQRKLRAQTQRLRNISTNYFTYIITMHSSEQTSLLNVRPVWK